MRLFHRPVFFQQFCDGGGAVLSGAGVVQFVGDAGSRRLGSPADSRGSDAAA